MYEKSCACGASKKNFKVDIGPFFVDECCIQNGYDELGRKKNQTQPETKPEEPKMEVESKEESKVEEAPQEVKSEEPKKSRRRKNKDGQ